MTDPFTAFGDAGDDEIPPGRESEVLVFRSGTEQALLQQVLHTIDATLPLVERQAAIVVAVDEFCLRRHWMMHVGNVKGPILEGFLKRCLANTQRSKTVPFVVVEIGTYCGYSLIRMASTMAAAGVDNFRIITVDVEERNVAVAKQMIKLAGLDDKVTFVLLENPQHIRDELSTRVRQALAAIAPDRTSPMLDFVFLDHAKDLYLADLCQLEQASLIEAGTFVCADNVFFFRLDDYRAHMADLADKGVVETRLEISQLEYVTEELREREAPGKDFRDGLELTVYLKDPPK